MSEQGSDVIDELVAPPEIQAAENELNSFIEATFEMEPLELSLSLRQIPNAQNICTLLLKMISEMSKLLYLPDVVMDDIEYAFRTLMDLLASKINRVNYLSRSSANLSKSQRIIKPINSTQQINPPGAVGSTEAGFPIFHSETNYMFKSMNSSKEDTRMLIKRIRDLEERLAEADQDRENSEKNITQLENEKNQINASKKKDKDTFNGELARVNSDLIIAKEELNAMKNHLKANENRIESLMKQLNDTTFQDDLKKEVTNLQNKLNKKNAKIADLALKNKMMELDATKGGERAPISEVLSQENIDLTAKYHKCKQTLKDVTKVLTEREEEFHNLSNIKDQAYDLIGKLKVYSEELEKENDKVEEMIRERTKENENFRVSLQKQTLENEENVRTLADFEEQLKYKNEEISILKTKFESLSKERRSPQKDSPTKVSTQDEQKYKDEINQLRGSIDILAKFIEDMVTKKDRETIPLLQGVTPIIEDDQIKANILDRIAQIKGRFDSFSKSVETELFGQIFGSYQENEQLIKNYIQAGRIDFYATVVALCAANKRLLDFIAYQDSVLETLNEKVPAVYENTEESLISFVADSRYTFDSLVKLTSNVHKEKITSENVFNLIKDLIHEIGGLLFKIDELREFLDFKDSTSDFPYFIKDYIQELRTELQTLTQVKDDQSEQIMQYQERIEQLEASQDTVSKTQLVRMQEKYEKEIASLREDLEMKSEEIEQTKVDNQNTVDDINRKLAQVTVTSENLIVQRDNFMKVAQAKDTICQNRIKDITIEVQKKFNDEMTIMKKKHDQEVFFLNKQVEKLAAKVAALKKYIAETKDKENELEKRSNESMLEKTIKQNTLIGKLNAQIQLYEEKLASISKSSASTAAANSSLKMVQNMLSSSPPSNSPPATPTTANQSVVTMTPTSSSASADLMNERFCQQVGKALSTYFKQENGWTRTRVINAIRTLIDRVTLLEKKNSSPSTRNSPTNNVTTSDLNNTINSLDDQLSPISSPRKLSATSSTSSLSTTNSVINSATQNTNANVNGMSSLEHRRLTELVRQNTAWIEWGNAISEIIGVNPESSEDVRSVIRDFAVSATSKFKLVSMMQSLRTQKKILLKYDLFKTANAPRKSGGPQEGAAFGDAIIAVICCLRFKKLYNKIQSHATLSPSTAKGNVTPVKQQITRMSITPK